MTATAPRVSSAATTRWYDEVRDDLKIVEQKMRESAVLGLGTLDNAVKGIIAAGGKRMRPALTLLTGRLFDAPLDAIYTVAASIELLHTATLVHDDLIDGAEERRGAPTLHSRLPIGITVLTGDFLFAQSAALAAEVDSVHVVRLFAETLVRICRGEILQAQMRWKVPSSPDYDERIYGKTAALFEASSMSAAILGHAAEHEIVAMADFGRELGMAFQIVDDALDFLGTNEQLGKPAGHDMSQGIFNLPVMFYVHAGYISADELNHQLNGGSGFDSVLNDIRKSGMVEKSLDVARQHIQRASDAVPHFSGNPHAEFLQNLTDYALARAY